MKATKEEKNNKTNKNSTNNKIESKKTNHSSIRNNKKSYTMNIDAFSFN